MNQNQLKVAINGAAGRMGQRVITLAQQDPDLEVVAALENVAHPLQGRDIGEVAGLGTIGVKLMPQLTDRVDVVIDFSTPAGLVEIARVCGERQIPLVAATTGLEPDQKEVVTTAAQSTPIVFAPSMSLAVNLMMKIVGDAAHTVKGLPGGVDVEIIERHHRFKEDAPSGTALHFGKIIADELGITEHVHGRQGRTGARPQHQIGYHALRVGDNVGEHTIVFGMIGESLEFHVRGTTRDSYAYGALTAAKFVATKGAGMYSMADVLGL
ncbi:MAG: 4-hydroxy-tetrahydrodipicolinate reductase [Planctomycetota bacterium]|nr:4-hydroxy-tetrahydrodipicolinate reductase [Planctomycetota bacterium]MDA1213067.1 4-hydroxy-tetrahydrodipicolinate reductase [Planctomycetota bacterium]